MKYMYAVKASVFSDPFIAFEDISDAAELAVSMNKGMEFDSLKNLVVRVPIFQGYEVLEGGTDGD